MDLPWLAMYLDQTNVLANIYNTHTRRFVRLHIMSDFNDSIGAVYEATLRRQADNFLTSEIGQVREAEECWNFSLSRTRRRGRLAPAHRHGTPAIRHLSARFRSRASGLDV